MAKNTSHGAPTSHIAVEDLRRAAGTVTAIAPRVTTPASRASISQGASASTIASVDPTPIQAMARGTASSGSMAATSVNAMIPTHNSGATNHAHGAAHRSSVVGIRVITSDDCHTD